MSVRITSLLVLLMLSLTLNAYFVVSAVQSRPSRGTGAVAPISQADPRAHAEDARSPRDYFEHLRALGLTVDETKPLLLSRLEAEFLSDAQGAFEEKYWDAGMNEDYLEAEVELVEEQDSVRAALIDIYGREAERDTAFRRVFRPLDPRLSVLTSAQQIAYEKYRLGRQLTETANVKTGEGRVGQRPLAAPGAVVVDHRSTVEELSKFLDPAVVAEVLYRYSALAERIRSAGLELTETEFRETFRSLEQLELGARTAATFLETRKSLRQLLGADRFARLWAARDPVYAALAAAGTELGLAEATTLAAYQIVNDRQELMAEVVQLQLIDPERAKTRMLEATAAQTARLSGLVGPEAAERLLRSLRVAAREVTGQSSVPAGLPPRAGQPAPVAR